MGPLWQYQSLAEPVDPLAGGEYAPATMDWLPSLPDLIPPGPALGVEPSVSNVVPIPDVAVDPADLTFYPSLPELPDMLPHPWAVLPSLLAGVDLVIPAIVTDAPVLGPPGAIDPLIDRYPDAPDRVRRHLERVAAILNSWIRKGYVGMERVDGVVQYDLFTGRYSEERDPGLDDDADIGAKPGMLWVNTATNAVWVNVDNSAGAAVWLRVTTS